MLAMLVGNTRAELATAPNIVGDALAHPTLPHVSLAARASAVALAIIMDLAC